MPKRTLEWQGWAEGKVPCRLIKWGVVGHPQRGVFV